MQTNPAVEQSKIVRWSESTWNQSGRKGKRLWRNGFAEEPRVQNEIRLTERVRDDESGDSEDGEDDDDELPCVMGESVVHQNGQQFSTVNGSC